MAHSPPGRPDKTQAETNDRSKPRPHETRATSDETTLADVLRMTDLFVGTTGEMIAGRTWAGSMAARPGLVEMTAAEMTGVGESGEEPITQTADATKTEGRDREDGERSPGGAAAAVVVMLVNGIATTGKGPGIELQARRGEGGKQPEKRSGQRETTEGGMIGPASGESKIPPERQGPRPRGRRTKHAKRNQQAGPQLLHAPRKLR